MNVNNQASQIKNEILVKLIKSFKTDDFQKNTHLIPFEMRPAGFVVPYRCCIYKEREIIRNRIIAGLGFPIDSYKEEEFLMDYAQKSLERTQPDKEVLTLIESACQGCVPNRIYVTDLCQGCVARPCMENCNFGAIQIINGRAQIDSSKCVNCGKCIKVCPYHAIVKLTVPCENACPVDAISKKENGIAKIDFEKCITCGKCVRACPFGAIHEKSQLIDVLKHIKDGKKVVAMLAPSVAGQIKYSIYKLKTALQQCGFTDVFEVAKGADTTTVNEAQELDERIHDNAPFMTTSCCAGYNNLVDKHIQEMDKFRSHTKTPLYYTAQYCKELEPEFITLFFSSCVAKNSEAQNNPNIDYVLNFEEMKSLFEAYEIDFDSIDETQYNTEASYEGRAYGILGGVSDAVMSACNCEFEISPHIINGITKESIKELKKYATTQKCDSGNLIEVMCCENGCVGGNDCTVQARIATTQVKKMKEFSKSIVEKTD